MQLEHRLSALLQLHLHSLLNVWVQWIVQKQVQYETRNIKVLQFGATYIRNLTVDFPKVDNMVSHYNHVTSAGGVCTSGSTA